MYHDFATLIEFINAMEVRDITMITMYDELELDTLGDEDHRLKLKAKEEYEVVDMG